MPVIVEYACRSKATVPHVPFSEPPVRAAGKELRISFPGRAYFQVEVRDIKLG